jgi:hypothetical protein
MYFTQVLDKVKLFTEQERLIQRDVNLSTQGKKRALDNLRESMVSYVGTANSLLSVDWRETRKAFQTLEQERLKALEAERRSWNYEQLNYESQRLRSLVSSKGFSAEELKQAWNQVKGEGNREGVRAFVESLPAIQGRSWDVTPGDVISEVKTAGETVRLTEELKGVRAKSQNLAEQTEQLYQTTATAAGWIERLVPGTSDIRRFLLDVNRSYQVKPETLETLITFTFEEPEKV